MIEKKDPRVNLEKNRATVFGIGLLAAGSFTLAAFTYTSPLEVEEAKIASVQSDVFYEVQQVDAPEIEPEITEDPEVEIVEEFTADALSEVTEESKAKDNSNEMSKSQVSSGTQKRIVKDIRVKVRRKKVGSAPVKFPDVEPEFIGGFVAFKKFILDTQVYPDDAIGIGDQGTAYVQFVVEKNGSVSQVKASGKVGRSLKKEAERVVKKSPKWKPGEVGGKPVRSYVQIPITFVLD